SMLDRTTKAAVAALFTAATACSGDLCDAQSLKSALASASPGQTVRMGACTISGSFEVKPDVTLAGKGKEVSRIVSVDSSAPIVLDPGTAATTLADLSVDSSARVAVRAKGQGGAAVMRVVITAQRGVAFGAENLEHLILDTVTAHGPVVSASPPAES